MGRRRFIMALLFNMKRGQAGAWRSRRAKRQPAVASSDQRRQVTLRETSNAKPYMPGFTKPLS